ncbi:unnamed protein product [Schistosoma mattheei]|uniref:Uncharacterized protein n=1 Tax=Schistosoma mattheei TaxID=31246 RepID=A0A183Q565_9TREM|nr:unnamed protein product [Schistosoma mattheei]
MLQPEVELNQALGEGVAYRGRLLLAIRSMEDEDVVRIGTSKVVASPVSELSYQRDLSQWLYTSIGDLYISNDLPVVRSRATTSRWRRRVSQFSLIKR